MTHSETERRMVWMVMALLLPWRIMLGQLEAGEGDKTPQVISESPVPFVLTVQEGRISLQAHNAPLKAVVEELGRQLHIAVVARLPAGERVTVTFERLFLEEVIQQLRQYAGITYTVQDVGNKPPEIIAMLVLPKRQDAGAAGPVTSTSDEPREGHVTASEDRPQPEDEGPHGRPAPFKFQFDPSQSLPNER